jgi:hypothetical protein
MLAYPILAGGPNRFVMHFQNAQKSRQHALAAEERDMKSR